LYSVLIGAATWRHELWYDEMQAWLIARDTHSLPGLFQALRYEGHPALWYLVLFIPSHLTWSPWPIKAINYLFAVTEGWLILSSQRVRWSFRLLAIFSFFIFYYFGTVARSYMLATLLLTAAVRCLLAERPRRKWAIVFLALAINTHILAIPIVVAIAVWGFCLTESGRWKSVSDLLRDAEFQIAVLALLASLAVAYLAVRPPPDPDPEVWKSENHSLVYNTFLSESRSWGGFIPAVPGYLPAAIRAWLYPEELGWFSSLFSLAVLVLIFLSLKSAQARMFFAGATTLELIALAATVRDPYMRHLSFLFVILLLALIIDAQRRLSTDRSAWFPQAAASAVVLSILAIQAAGGIYASATTWIHPHSKGKEVAVWLKERGLDKNPMVLEGYFTLPVIGYLERSSAYSTACQCFASYAVWNEAFFGPRITVPDDIKRAGAGSTLPVVLIRAGKKMEAPDAQALGLVEILSYQANGGEDEGAYTVYEQEKP